MREEKPAEPSTDQPVAPGVKQERPRFIPRRLQAAPALPEPGTTEEAPEPAIAEDEAPEPPLVADGPSIWTGATRVAAEFREFLATDGLAFSSLLAGALRGGARVWLTALGVAALGLFVLYALPRVDLPEPRYQSPEPPAQLWPAPDHGPHYPRNASPQTQADHAEQAVLSYFRALQNQDLSTAYAWLSPEWAAQLPYQRFCTGYRGVSHRRVRILAIEHPFPGRARVDVQLRVKDQGGVRDYQGRYHLTQSAGDWRLEGGTLWGAAWDEGA